MKNRIRLFTLLLALAVVFGLAVSVSAAETVDSGTCGENVTWMLDDGGTLTISGAGAMEDYASASASPWYSKRTSIKAVVIGSGVTTIGDRAFFDCIGITTFSIPESVTYIGDYAFYKCSSLDGITLPGGVTSIGEYAFSGCSSLTGITIPEGVTSIGGGAFRNCSNLTRITLPEGMTSIDTRTFEGCSRLTGITFPESMTNIGDYAFSDCSSLTGITLPESVVSIGSSAFYGCSSLTSIAIPGSVTSIGDSAFYGCSSLTSITIPEGVTSIGGSAFYGCSSLTSITIPEGVTSIGGSAFYGCSSLTSITIPDGVTSINNYAFKNCSSLTSIMLPESVTSIGYDAFYGCSSLTSITIPEGVTSIGDSAFYGCSSLTSVSIPEGVTCIGKGTFYRCSNLTSITIPESVTRFEESAFSDCSSLTSILIPESVNYISDWVFHNCSNLIEVTFEGDAPNSSYTAFDGVIATVYYPAGNATWTEEVMRKYGGTLTWVPTCVASGTCGENITWTLKADGVLTISGTGDMTDYASALDIPWCDEVNVVKTAVISEGVTSIGSNAFANCTGMTSITIPESVTSIGSSAFAGCSGLAEVIFEGDAPSIGDGVFANVTATGYYPRENATWTEETKQNYGGTITWEPQVVTVASGTCGDSLTWTLDSAGTLTISGSGRMKDYYSRTIPWYDYRVSIKSVVIEKSVTSIGNYAFSGCSSLTGITIPEGVTSIGNYAFSGCSSLTGITIPEGVTSIGNHAFFNCSSLTGITIPGSVTSIGNYAFSGCSSLTGITIPEGVTSIGEDAFYGCSSLTGITIPEGVTSIENYAFGYCSSLTGITIPEGVTSIGNYAFSGCSSLTSITIPDGVTSIGYEAFSGCSSLTSITIPDGVTSIGFSAFSGCSSLAGIWVDQNNECYSSDDRGVLFNKDKTELIQASEAISGAYAVPESVTSIGYGAFYGCSSLTSVTIPGSVTSIENYAFGYCSSLSVIVFEGDAPSMPDGGDNTFYGVNATAYYPEGYANWPNGAKQNYGGYITWVPYIPLIGSGTCGENITWTLKADGVLTISGTGDMTDYASALDIPWCDEVTHVKTAVISEGVTSIGNYAFANCTGMTSVEIPDSVTDIGNAAFADCTGMTSITIPESVTSIGSSAFKECSSLTEVAFEGDAPNIAADALSSVTATAYYPVYNATWSEEVKQNYGGTLTWTPYKPLIASGTCGKNLTWALEKTGILTISGTGNMMDYAAASDVPWADYRESITTVVFPDNLTGIGDYAFYGCAAMTSVTIPRNVISIGDHAFNTCCSLTSVTIPASVTGIGKWAFSGCSELTEIKFEGDGPDISVGAFYYVTATAYYPGDNTTWTVAVKKNYGGKITWVPCTEETAIPTLTLMYPSLSFESEINYNIYFTVSDAEVAVEDLGLITWYKKPASLAVATVDKAEYVIPGAVYNSARGEYMVKTQGVPAMRMGDDLYLRVYAKLADGTYAYSAVTYYSARDYAESILATSSNEDMKALCVAMLNYGAAAQVHFNHNTGNLMNAGLTDEQQALAADWSAEMMRDVITPDSAKTVNFVSNGGFSGGYPSVSFDGAFAINYFFTAKQTPDTDILLFCWDEETYLAEDVLTEENAVRVLTMKDTGTSGKYMAAYSGIPAKDIGKTLFVAAVYKTGDVRYSSPVVAYSLGAYCQDRIENGSDTMKTLARETAVYGWYAENYFAGQNG